MRIIVLTRSDKHFNETEGGYCVAGLNHDNPGQWVRLLGRHDYMKITNAEAMYNDGTLCEPLDIIEVDNPVHVDEVFYNANIGTYRDFADYRVQPENYLVPVSPFTKIGRISIEDLLQRAPIDTTPTIFGNTYRRLEVPEAISNNSSLVMIRVTGLELYPEENYNRGGYKAHYKARFHYNGNEYTDISVTDPEYAAELTDYTGMAFADTFLIVSLGELFNGKHYKLIAKIFETVYTISNNRLNYFHAFKDCRYLERYQNDLHKILWQDAEKEGLRPCPTCLERV